MTPAVLAALVAGTIIPAITAAVTSYASNVKTKALVAVGLSVIVGIIDTVLTTPPQGTAQWEALIGSMLITWIASSSAYIAAWKPSRVAADINERTASFGFGPVGR